ncbi:MAG: hypothetical protein PHG25_00850 [Candidatus Pacebacteria bacterium]|nr:hypothetical protein [Candidatus Paceibacterota bacterium]
MSKRQLIILFAALIILLALISGFPSFWKSTLDIVLAGLIIFVAYTTTKQSNNSNKRSVNAPYVDAHGGVTSAPAFRAPSESVKKEPVLPVDEITTVASSEVTNPVPNA